MRPGSVPDRLLGRYVVLAGWRTAAVETHTSRVKVLGAHTKKKKKKDYKGGQILPFPWFVSFLFCLSMTTTKTPQAFGKSSRFFLVVKKKLSDAQGATKRGSQSALAGRDDAFFLPQV